MKRKKTTLGEKVTVYLNDKEMIVFSRLRIRDLLTPEQVCTVLKGDMSVKDSYGHIVGLDGALMHEERYTLNDL
jgi:hypothetical protein